MSKESSRIVALLWLGLVAATPIFAESGWSGFRGPTGTGQAADLPPGDGPLRLDLAWKRPLGSGYAGISIAANTLVTAGAYGDRDYVLAFDPATGEERWRYDLAPAHRGHDGTHDGPIATPAIAGGRVFALSPAGQVAAVDLETGRPLWTVHLADDLGSEKPFYDFGSSPVVVGDTMVLQIGGEGGSVAGFDVATGEVRWRVHQDGICTESPIQAELAGRAQVVVLGTRYVAGLDPSDGTVLWSVEHGGGPGISLFASPLPLDADRVLVQTSGDASSIVQVTSGGGEFSASIAPAGLGMTKTYSPPTRVDGVVYGYTSRFLSALDPASGELLWRSREPGDGFLISIGDQLAVLTKTGSLHLGPANPGGWSEIQSLELFDDLAWTPPSYDQGSIYVRSLGEIARVDLVRAPDLTAAAGAAEDVELPAALQRLAAELATAEDPRAVVDRFLAGRELPLIDGEEVVFVWRGDAKDLAVAGDMIGMRREEPMHRLPVTDLWWWATELDRRARISYFFYVDNEATVDPSHDRRAETQVLGVDRNWNRTGEPVRMSWFAMPEWPGLRAAAPAQTRGEEARGTIDLLEMKIEPPAREGQEPPEPVEVALSVWLPPDYAQTTDRYPVVYVRSGQALELGGWPATLDRVVGTSVAPLIVVFVDLPPMRGAGSVLAEQVVPAVDERYRTLPDRDHRAVVGMGWGSFSSAALLFENPGLFGALGVQSFYALDEPMEELLESLGDQNASTVPLRIYLEWGRWDLISPHENMNMRVWGRRGWDLFRERGWEPQGGEVWDSTDWPSWRNRTAELLGSLFPIDGVGPDLSTWQTGAIPGVAR